MEESFAHDLAIVAILKDEGAYLVEWLEYHMTTGVSKFYLYDNDSTDGTAELLKPYVKCGLVEYMYFPGKYMQNFAYTDAVMRHKYECRYMAFIDLDEFILPLIDESVYDVTESLLAHTEAKGLGVCWCVFGSSGHETKPAGGVLENYLNHGSATHPENLCYKTIANPRYISHFTNPHYPIYIKGYYAVDEKSRPLSNTPFLKEHSSEKIRINHYFTKSREEWRIRRNRGYAERWSDLYGYRSDNVVNDDSLNAIKDTRILEYRKKIASIASHRRSETLKDCARSGSTRDVILYGAGEAGFIIGEALRIKDRRFIYCDRKYTDSVTVYGVPTVSIADLNESPYVSLPIIITSAPYFGEIYNELQRNGISAERIYDGMDLYRSGCNALGIIGAKPQAYVREILKAQALVRGCWLMPYLDVIITERCTLNCTACSSLMPYYTSHRQNYAATDIVPYLDKILQADCFIVWVTLIGGEPLLNQDCIIELLRYYANNRQIGEFRIYTNGTVLPTPNLIEVMQQQGKCRLVISDYGSLSFVKEKLCRMLASAGIGYTVLNDDNSPWWTYGKLRHYCRTAHEHQNIYDNCYETQNCRCRVLLKDKLSFCNRIAHGMNLGVIPPDKSNYADLNQQTPKSHSWREYIRDYLNRRQYPLGCEYCAIDVQRAEMRALQTLPKTESV